MTVDSGAPLLRWVTPAHWILLDRLVGLGYGMLAFVALLNHASSMATGAAALTGAACLGVPVAMRRCTPVIWYSVVVAALLTMAWVSPSGVVLALPPLVLVLYSAAAATSFRVAVALLPVSCAAVVLPAFPDLLHPGGLVAALPAVVVSWSLGVVFGLHRRHLRTQVELQERIRVSEVQRAAWELGEQRVQIARELHDVVAHGVSVITVQAGFAGLVMDDRDQVASALRSIETAGRQTLVEMRSLLAVLRTSDADPADPSLSPAPSLRDLDALVARTRAAGVEVTLMSRGADLDLSPLVELAAYRIVQEALTNVVRHAGHARATVDLDHGPARLTITVCDDGQGGEASEGVPGHGITGMRERAHAVGGTLRVGPLPDRGFVVTASLPVPPRPEVATALDQVRA
jgi:signal transduction histidine kinase